ncbi:MAG: carbohydrate binding domain-containing protein [Spirochaetaceae bacterium]|jgi:hypothetical protein|nr:carbohydrate binding domain-containing protein [Spirochaetaceae bacterium]
MSKIAKLFFVLFAVVFVFAGCVSSPGAVETTEGPNMLVNGDFEAGQDPWTPWIDTGWGGAGEVIWEDGIATLRVDDAGEAPWAVAMHYKKNLIEKDERYILRFDAKADENRVIRTGLGNGLAPADPPYLNYQDVEITTEWQTYEFEFKMKFRTDRFGRIDFNCAANAGMFLPEGHGWTEEQLFETSSATVYLDNVELRKFVPVEEAAE